MAAGTPHPALSFLNRNQIELTNLPLFQVKAKVIMNSLSLFVATSGIILSIMDILNITVSHFLKMERLNLSKAPNLYVDIYNCEPANSSDKNSPSTQYCYSMQSVFLVSMEEGSSREDPCYVLLWTLTLCPGSLCLLFFLNVALGKNPPPKLLPSPQLENMESESDTVYLLGLIWETN